MNNRRLITLTVTIFLIVVASYGWTSFQARPEAAVAPETVTVELERSVEQPQKTTDELIALWQGRIEKSPHDYISTTYLGQAYLNKARETADGSNYTRAEAAFRQALEVNPSYAPAKAFLGSVYFAQHEFAQALTLAADVYASDPKALHALALLGDAQLELGNYDAAAAAYAALDAKIESPAVVSRLARLAWLRGEPDLAITLMQKATQQADDLGLTGEAAAWYQFQLGELLFNTGQLDKAEAQYTAALNTFDGYYLAMAGLGKTAAARGDLDTAIGLYEDVVARVPQPEFVARLGDLYTLAGNDEAAQQQYATVAVLAELEAQNGVLFDRQLVLFYTNHDESLEKALALAEAELETRQDIYGYDALAWALYKNGRYSDATAAIERAMTLGTQDAMLYYHAGMIQAALGNHATAKTLLDQALALNPHFDLLQTVVARETLADLTVNTK